MIVEIVAALSADGKIAEASDQRSLDWTSKEDLKFFIQKTKQAGVVIMGRKTFETIGKPLKDRLTIVMTSTPEKYEDIEGELLYTSQSPQEILDALKQKKYERVVITGGSKIYGLFLREGLVTDLYLTIEPVLFGTGVPFADGFDRMNLKLIDGAPMGDQAILLHYQTT